MKDDPTLVQQTEAHPVEPEVQVILNSVPEDKKEEVLKALTVIQSESFSGPIPPPRALKQYESILPGAADRIITMAETQAAHRMELEKKVIGGQTDQSNRGQIFGFIIFFACILVAFLFAALFDMKSFAASFLSVTMAILVGIFVTGKNNIKKDLKEKSEDQQQ